MEFIKQLGEVAKTATLLFAAVVIAALIFWPGLLGTRLVATLTAMEDAGLEVEWVAGGLKARIAKVQDEVTASDDLNQQLQQEIASLEAELAAARAGEDQPAEVVVAPPNPWVVIAGAETDAQSQMREVNALRAARFDATLYLSGGWYQTGVVYDSRTEAQSALSDITDVVGAKRAPYLRAFDAFCPAPSPSDAGLVTCNG